MATDSSKEADLEERQETLECWFGTMEPLRIGKVQIEACTHVGLRKMQEDRMLICPRLFREGCSFLGIFDGTVGDHASEYVRNNILQHFVGSKSFRRIRSLIGDPLPSPTHENDTEINFNNVEITNDQTNGSNHNQQRLELIHSDIVMDEIRDCFHQCFHSTDEALITYCQTSSLHYASCTAVSVLILEDLLTVSHVGDSKACIIQVYEDGRVEPVFITHDHKPDQPDELARIEAAGGSLAWLHGKKPYIRGGDFFERQSRGEHPKQLNYSRAFGGKDLKMFGLSIDPDISHFRLTRADKLLVIASDGLWDVISLQLIADIALDAAKKGRNPSVELARVAVDAMPSVGVCDNVSVIVAEFFFE